MAEEGVLFVIVEVMSHVAAVSRHSAAYRTAGWHDAWPTEYVELALAWYVRDDGNTVVLKN